MYKVIRRSSLWFILSGTLMVLSIAAIAIFGLRLGIDYKGGTVIEFRTDSANKNSLTEEVLKENNLTGYQIKAGDKGAIIVRLPALTNEEHLTLSKGLTQKLGSYTEISYDTVGATISKDLINKSILAVILSSLGIIFYIAYAFRKVPRPLSSWKFGASAVIALIHDLLITTGIVAVIGHFVPWMEVDALFLTALLTIMGFSVHDTIVVYDRLRENFIKNPYQDLDVITEESVNQTLVRSLNTSITVIMVLLSLFLLGGASIKHFVLTLIIGVFFGTYSSIFVASAIVARWHKKQTLKKA